MFGSYHLGDTNIRLALFVAGTLAIAAAALECGPPEVDVNATVHGVPDAIALTVPGCGTPGDGGASGFDAAALERWLQEQVGTRGKEAGQ